VISKRPDFVGGANAELTATNFNGYEGAASINGPLVDDKLAGRFYAAYRRRNGLYDVSTGDGTRQTTEDANRDVVVGRGQLLFTPSESVSALFIADYARRTENCCGAVQNNDGPTAPLMDAVSADSGVSRPADPFARVQFANRSDEQEVRDMGLSAELNFETSFGKITSITAWRNFESTIGQDADYSTGDVLWRNTAGPNGNEFKQLSEELRFSGETDRLEWMVGAFYAGENLDSDLNLLYGADFETYYSLVLSAGMAPTLVNILTGRPAQTAYPTGAGYQDRFEQRSDSFAVFTNETFHFTERLHGTIGLRYTSEQKDLDSSVHELRQRRGMRGLAGALSHRRGRAARGRGAGLVQLRLRDVRGSHLQRCQHVAEHRRKRDQRHGQAGLRLQRRVHDLPLLRAWLQGQRLQSGSRAHPYRFDRRALVRLRSGHELQT
jgi:hypothetical protein